MKNSSFRATNIDKLLILTSCTKFELIEKQWNHNEITITDLFSCREESLKSEMTSYLRNGDDVIMCFVKFEKFLPHSIIMPSFMTVRRQRSELDRVAFLQPPIHNR